MPGPVLDAGDTAVKSIAVAPASFAQASDCESQRRRRMFVAHLLSVYYVPDYVLAVFLKFLDHGGLKGCAEERKLEPEGSGSCGGF